jgi:hypothetical protein
MARYVVKSSTAIMALSWPIPRVRTNPSPELPMNKCRVPVNQDIPGLTIGNGAAHGRAIIVVLVVIVVLSK